jgi:hypothetical protein
MQKFRDFGITAATNAFSGDKIKIDRLLNRKIIVQKYRVENSKFEGKGKCLHMQIAVDGVQKVVFSGSANLIAMIEQVPPQSFPFETTIVKDNERLIFT